MGLKVACSKMAELELRWVTRVCLDRTSEKCEGCDVVGSDHAPQAGVAQGV